MMIHVHVFYCFKFCTHLGFNPLTELAVKYSMSWHFQWYGYQFFNSEFKKWKIKNLSVAFQNLLKSTLTIGTFGNVVQYFKARHL